MVEVLRLEGGQVIELAQSDRDMGEVATERVERSGSPHLSAGRAGRIVPSG